MRERDGKKLKRNSKFSRDKVHTGMNSFGRAMLVSLGLGLFNLIFVLGPYLAVAGVMLSLWAVSLALVLSGIVSIIAGVVQPLLDVLFVLYLPMTPDLRIAALLLGIFFCSLGLLGGIGMIKLSHSFFRLNIRYLKMNHRLIIGETGMEAEE